MPVNRLVFLLFVLVLAGGLLYLKYGPGRQQTEPVSLTPKQYIERVQEQRRQSADQEDALAK